MTIPLPGGTLTLSEEEARALYENLRGKFGARRPAHVRGPGWPYEALIFSQRRGRTR